MRTPKGLRRASGIAVVLAAAVATGLVGWASTGHAATSFDVTLAPLIGTTDVNVIPQVSYGGKIGYHLHIKNSGNSTTQHGSIVVTSDLATFSDTSDTTNCAVNPKDAHQMVCTPFGGTFTPGTTFDVDLRFTAPTTGPSGGEQVSTVGSISVAAQTVGGNKTNGTTIAQSAPVLTNIVENTTKADTYLHQNEKASTGKLGTGHPQNFGVQMPGTLLGNPFGVALSIHDNVGTPICDTCLTSFTTLTIPVASFATKPGNPFFDLTTVNPFPWSMSANYTGTAPTLVVHVDDNNVRHNLPTCESLANGLTAAEPMCYFAASLVTTSKPPGAPKTISVAGLGLENGNLGFG